MKHDTSEALGDTSYEMPADGYNGKDIIEIGKDLAVKHPEIKDYSDEERLKRLDNLVSIMKWKN